MSKVLNVKRIETRNKKEIKIEPILKISLKKKKLKLAYILKRFFSLFPKIDQRAKLKKKNQIHLRSS
jgi:hypothetical protein